MRAPTPLGDSDSFALECQFHERDGSGVTSETLEEKVPDPFAFVEFVDSGDLWIVHTEPNEDTHIIDAELEMVEDTDAHCVAESIAKALSGTSMSVVLQRGTRDYYIVSEGPA